MGPLRISAEPELTRRERIHSENMRMENYEHRNSSYAHEIPNYVHRDSAHRNDGCGCGTHPLRDEREVAPFWR